MLHSTAHFETEHGKRYATQLCRHFAHKIETVETEEGGECRFSIGIARLRAAPDRLIIEATAPTAGELAELQSVMERHLQRFAFREGDRQLDWAA